MRVRTAIALLLVLVLSCVAAGSAAAQQEGASGPAAATGTSGTVSEPGGTTTGSAPETGSTAEAGTTTSGGAESKPSDADDNDNRGIAIVIFALGGLAIALAYAFYDRWRASYETLALSALKTTGRFPDTIFNPVEDAQFGTRGAVTGQPPQKPVVTGPVAVAVNESATYSAAVDGSPADSCNWTIEPADAATVEPATGASVTVTAGKAGPFALSAKIGDGEPTLVHVAAVAKAGGGGVPLLGTGFAGFAAAIIAIVLAGGLTVLDVLGSEAFIAFLGPLIGYFFAQGRDTGRSAAE